jgi:DNA-binding CsgD family transcriptional regulator
MSVATRSQAEPLALLEREAALDELREALAESRAGGGRVVLVAGEAGIGKTALVDCFCRESRGRARVLVGACDPLFTPRPLGPLVDVADTTGGELQELIGTRAIPYRIAAVLMEELRKDAPTVLVLEDVHWADEATLDVFRLVARRIDNASAVLIATYRDDELEANHPLRGVLGSLATGQSIRRIRLPRLSASAVAALAKPYEVDAEPLYRMTSGNPFFVTEILAGGVVEQIPATVRDAVLARVARLSPGARSVLEAVSVVPSETELWLLEALAEPVDGELAECLGSGTLVADSDTVAFPHELARVTVEDSLSPDRRNDLHRRALVALEGPMGSRNLARLAHHADAAGEAGAVLRFAPEAAARASSVGAHREAAAQYRRALRFAQDVSLDERAQLLEQHSHECYLTDAGDEAVGSLRAAIDCYRELGDRRREGATLSRLAGILWCPGRGEEARRVGVEAVSLLEQAGCGRELALACSTLSFHHRMNADLGAAQRWSDRAVALAEELEDSDELSSVTPPEYAAALARVFDDLAALEVTAGLPGGKGRLERRIDLARSQGLHDHVFGQLLGLMLATTYRGPWILARGYIEDGLEYSREHGLDLMHLYFLAFRSRLELDECRWTDAAESAELVLGECFVSTFPRTVALVTLALVRARRGDPGARPVLDEARALSEPTGELPRTAPVAAARAEAAWLSGRDELVADETDAAYRLAVSRGAPWAIGELATVRWRAGIEEELPDEAPEPHRLQIIGEWQRAAQLWTEIGCPYEAALALADSDLEPALRSALDELNRLGARPAAEMVAKRLRRHGARAIPRGPRAATRSNPAGLTTRESEVLELLAEGLKNAAIADRLFLSRRTIDHHVSAILRKLDAGSRTEAIAAAQRSGLLQNT